MPKPLPLEVQAKMVAAYLQGEPSTRIAARFGCKYGAVLAAVRRNGCVVRGHSAAHRRYSIREGYFEDIQSETQAYLLGFLTADSHIRVVHKVPSIVSLRVQARDRWIIDLLRREVAPETPEHRYSARFRGKEHPVAGVHICSQTLAKTLVQHWTAREKTLRRVPKKIPNELLPHYFRGLVDGDGSLGEGHSHWRLRLHGPKTLVSAFQTFVQQHVQTSAALLKPRSTQHPADGYLYQLIGGPLVRTIVDILYGGTTIALPRKLTMAHRILVGQYSKPNLRYNTSADRDPPIAVQSAPPTPAGERTFSG